MEPLDDMHEFENDAKRKAYLIKEGKEKYIQKKNLLSF